MATYKAQDFVDAIPGSGGIISAIAQRVGCNWYTAKRYIEKYPTVRRAYDDECEKISDLAETVIIKDIQTGSVQTAKWYLTMKGRGRGYAKTERNELVGAGGGPVELLVRYERLLAEIYDDDDDDGDG